MGQGRSPRTCAGEASTRVEIGLTTGEWIVPDLAGATCPRLTHGMNDWTWPLVQDAFRRGHDTRVGFEDSVLLPGGTRADDNAQLVRAALELRASLSS